MKATLISMAFGLLVIYSSIFILKRNFESQVEFHHERIKRKRQNVTNEQIVERE